MRIKGGDGSGKAPRIAFTQINLRHDKSATAHFVRRFVKQNVAIALIQEPYTHWNVIRGLNNAGSVFGASGVR